MLKFQSVRAGFALIERLVAMQSLRFLSRCLHSWQSPRFGQRPGGRCVTTVSASLCFPFLIVALKAR